MEAEHLAESIDLEPPDLVGASLSGGWQVVRHVAVGAMGHVYEARHTDDGPACVAVKVLHGALVSEADVAFRFRREADILDAIESPHVPRVFDRGRASRGRPFIVMEFLAGQEISRLLEEHGVLPVRLALEIARQICLALKAAHRAGITHRDLKPENVVVCGDLSAPNVKLLDFSVSKTEDIALTQPGTLLGTPAYMPPEQALGRPVTVQFDVYAVGAVLYEMLTGRPPFDGPDTRKTLFSLLTEEAPRPRALDPHIPEAVEAIVLGAIAKDPNARTRTVDALMGAINGVLDQLTSGSYPRIEAPAVNPSPALAPAAGPLEVLAGDSTRTVPARRHDSTEVAYWAVGFAIMGPACVVLLRALAFANLPLPLIGPAALFGLLLGWVLGRAVASPARATS